MKRSAYDTHDCKIYIISVFYTYGLKTEMYLEPRKTSKTEFFAIIGDGLKALAIFTKSSILVF